MVSQKDSIQNGYDSKVIKTTGTTVFESTNNIWIPGESISTTVTFPKYIVSTQIISAHQIYNVTSFGLPVYVGYSYKVGNHLYFEESIGAIFSYQQAKQKSSNFSLPDPTIRTMGVKIAIRPQIRYQFNCFGVSLSSNMGYDLLPALNWNGITRSRYYPDIRVGVHFMLK